MSFLLIVPSGTYLCTIVLTGHISCIQSNISLHHHDRMITCTYTKYALTTASIRAGAMLVGDGQSINRGLESGYTYMNQGLRPAWAEGVIRLMNGNRCVQKG